MEDCDSVRGFQIAVDGDMSFFSGLATSVLEELGDECKSAAKFSIMVGDGDSFRNGAGPNGTGAGVGGEEEDGRYWRSENKAVGAFRSNLNSGLALHGINENSDLVLPLSLSKCWKSLHKQEETNSRNLFEASAAGALALEAATLPYRLARNNSTNSNRRSKIGIGSGYFQGSSQADEDAVPTADKLSYHEFISSLKASNRHTITELSGSLNPTASPGQVHQSLLQGTSIERRQLEEERNRNRSTSWRSRGQDVDPGAWLEDEGANGGLMTSLSPIPDATSARSLHQHFALASSLRPLPSRVGNVVSTYTAAMMEGMAIRYRPQCSMASVVGQSVHALTGSRAGSAGLYWNSIIGKTETAQTLTVLGNSTRIHSHLRTTATGLTSALSRKYAGYLSRDGMSGLAPEGEDCTDAMEACLSLRDVYEPSSMRFDSDEEGDYFEDE